MECPYCKKELREGFIPTQSGRVKWVSGSPEGYSALDEREEVWLSEYPMWKEKGAPAYLCPECKMVLIPVGEFEGTVDQMGRMVKNVLGQVEEKWNAAVEKLDCARKDRQESRREKELEKQRDDIKKGKDPWEL